MIAGFEDPSGGTIELAGEDVSGVPPYDRAVNTVFQDYALFPHMTVGENVAYGLRVAGVAKAERARRRDEALEMVRLPGYGDRKPGELSGGQRQRVALARAIVNRPKVLLLDEPLGALDLKLREQMQIELKTIQGEVGITFVYVTHDQDEALTMSDRIAVFNEGRIEQVSPPVELYEQPGDRVRRRLRRRLQPARARRRALHDPPREDPAARPPATAPNGLRTERGRIADVAYAGMVTRYTVALDAGGELQLVRQNVESASVERGLRAGQGGPGRLAPGAHGRRPREINYRGGITVRTQDAHPARTAWLVVAGLLAFMLLLAGCGVQRQRARQRRRTEKLGKGEGEVNLISWAGYVEPEWTKPFEEKTGCKVNDKVAGTSDEMVQLMRTGQYDGVSASGNASARLVDGGDVAPVNVEPRPQLQDDLHRPQEPALQHLRRQPLRDPARSRREPADVEHQRRQAGADLLGRDRSTRKWRPSTRARSAPTTTRSTSPTRRVYLKAHEPDLGIENPYELNEEQFEAAVEPAEGTAAATSANTGRKPTKQISAFASGDTEVGTTWQYQYFAAEGRRQAGRGEPGEPGLPARRGGDRAGRTPG